MQLPDFLTRDADGFIHVAGRRIGLDQLVFYYREGYSAEMLAEEFPSVPLAVIHKVFGYYLKNESAVDDYVAKCRQQSAAQETASGPGISVLELRRRATQFSAP